MVTTLKSKLDAGTLIALKLSIVDTTAARTQPRRAVGQALVVGAVAACLLGCGGGPTTTVHGLKAPNDNLLHAPSSTNEGTAWRDSKRAGFLGGETEHKYPLTITAPAVVRVVLEDISKGQDYDLFLLTNSGRELYFSRTLDNRVEYIETGFLSPGSYRISVLNYRGDVSTKAYRLSVEVYGSKQASRPATSNTSIARETGLDSRT